MATSAPLILNRLTKQYPGMPALALDGVSLQVAAGEVYGFLGANGAGKSTTIRTLLNFIQPTSGTASIAGYDIVDDAVTVKSHVGYLAGEIALYSKVTGKQLLSYMAALQPPKHKTYVRDLTERFAVPTNQPIETLSKGNRQKLGIVQAFMHEPDVLILDEPTSGLDPLMQEEFFKLVHETRGRGGAVFLSSHNLAEAQRICDRVGIIKHGKLILEQVVTDLTDLSTPVFKVRLSRPTDLAKLKHATGLRLVTQVDGATLLLQPTASIAHALASLSKFDIASIATEQTDLEEEFMKFYEDKP